MESIKDAVRGSVIVKDYASAPDVIRALKNKGLKNVEVTIDEPLNKFGYRGIHLSGDLGDGINGEVQIHSKKSWDLKIYHKWRNLTDSDVTDLTAEEQKEYFSDIEKNQTMWKSFWDDQTREVRDAIISAARESETGLESVTAPSLPEKSSHLPADDNTSGTLPSFMGEASSNRPSRSIENREVSDINPPNEQQENIVKAGQKSNTGDIFGQVQPDEGVRLQSGFDPAVDKYITILLLMFIFVRRLQWSC
jgi:hypothetical protein